MSPLKYIIIWGPTFGFSDLLEQVAISWSESELGTTMKKRASVLLKQNKTKAVMIINSLEIEQLKLL